jgi:hypothetical protein
MEKKIVIVDGQGGKMGQLLIEQIKSSLIKCKIFAIGTNSISTANMLKSGADYGATGENPIIVNCRDADIIVGPIGIIVADSLFGEITSAVAVAVAQSRAEKILLPINRCNTHVVGTQNLSVADLIALAVERIKNSL